MVRWAQPLLPCIYVLNKPKESKNSIGEASYRESYRGRSSDPHPPDLGFRQIKSTVASESLENLHACVPNICV
jgi:hypothetical protein